MKRSISWHEDCLKNSKFYYQFRLDSLKREEESLARLKEHNDFYKEQIKSAKSEGKQNFDRERYKFTRKKTEVENETTKTDE